MNFKTTLRGFSVANFTDLYGSKCSLQKSSLADKDAIWLGVSTETVMVCKPNEGFSPIDVAAVLGVRPCDVSIATRMHLSREMVAAMLPALHHFVETGELPPPSIATD